MLASVALSGKEENGLTILNYTVTSNHIHMLVMDDHSRDVIPKSMQLVAGRSGQEYTHLIMVFG